MKKLMIGAAIATMASVSSFAEVKSLSCVAKKGDIEITLTARMGLFDGEKKVGLIKSYDLLILGEVQRELNGVKFQDHTSISDRNILNEKYTGRKYKGYLKFNLMNYRSESLTMNGELEDISFIVSPKYKVVNTEASGNYWDDQWTWDVETREFDAVFPLNLNDHHGDYILGKCYSTAIVNEVKP